MTDFLNPTPAEALAQVRALWTEMAWNLRDHAIWSLTRRSRRDAYLTEAENEHRLWADSAKDSHGNMQPPDGGPYFNDDTWRGLRLVLLRRALTEALAEIDIDNRLLADQDALLDAFPPCPEHGRCIPHAGQYLQRAGRLEMVAREIRQWDMLHPSAQVADAAHWRLRLDWALSDPPVDWDIFLGSQI